MGLDWEVIAGGSGLIFFFFFLPSVSLVGEKTFSRGGGGGGGIHPPPKSCLATPNWTEHQCIVRTLFKVDRSPMIHSQAEFSVATGERFISVDELSPTGHSFRVLERFANGDKKKIND